MASPLRRRAPVPGRRGPRGLTLLEGAHHASPPARAETRLPSSDPLSSLALLRAAREREDQTLNWRDSVRIGVAIAGGLLALQVLEVLFRPLLLLLAATILACAIGPVVSRLDRRLPYWLALLLVYAAILAAFALLVWVVVPPIVQQATGLARRAPELVEELQRLTERLDVPVEQQRIVEMAQGWVGRFAATLAGLPFRVLSSSLELLVVVTMSAYLVVAARPLTAFLLSLFPTSRRAQVRDALDEMGRTMGGYVRGTLLEGLILASITYVGLVVIGVDFPLVLAVLTFIGALIPVIGPMISGAPALAVAFVTESWVQAATVLAFYFVLQQVETHLLLPNVMRAQADIPPLLTVFALIAGGAIAGFLGALLAVPTLGALRVLAIRVVAPSIRRWSGAEA